MKHVTNQGLKFSPKESLFILALLAASLCYFRFISGSAYLTAPKASWYMPVAFFANAWLSFFLLLVLAIRSRTGAYVILPILLLTQALYYYVKTRYGNVLESELITAALETSWGEISGFIKPYFYIAIPTALVLMFAGIYQMRKRLTLPQRLGPALAWGLFTGYVFLSTSLLYAGVAYFPRTTSYLTYSQLARAKGSPLYREQVMSDMVRDDDGAYIHRLYLPFYPVATIIKHTRSYYDAGELTKAESFDSELSFDDPDLLVVLIIGESFRADHSPWNGYGRDTLPRTTLYRDHIINFPYVKSYATSTVTSIYGMISDASCTSRKAEKTSFLGVLKKHGVRTNLFTSDAGYWYNHPHISKLIDGKVDNLQRPGTHGEIEEAVAEAARVPGKDAIIIEDGIGHGPYKHDPEFSAFDESEPYEMLNMNAYDNCLVQVDSLFARIIEQLKDKNAILFYCSDHGQSFGENGFYLHGGLLTAEKQRHVFTFVWYSDQYRERHPDIVAALEANRNKALSHDYIYHSIISMAGIRSDAQDPALDMTRPLDQPDVSSFSLGDEQPHAEGDSALQAAGE